MIGGRATRVLVDANILYSRTLRDWLSLLYLRGGHEMFEVFWTEDIMAETLYHRRRNNPFLAEEQVGGIRRKIAQTFGENSLITGYTVDKGLDYPDSFDAHVHCAAVHADIDIVLTANGCDFEGIDDLIYEIHSADDFFPLIDDHNHRLVRKVVCEQLAYWVPRRGKALPQAMREAGAPAFAERIRQHLQSADAERVLASLSAV
ncbi:PIN domain-containing protein [Nocardia cyriacigeorgica]|uniref:PIN domain-containing protein n=1 Tax=Nocardia cyriacigeorgica TaxID=135487 RepID=UPI001894050A|nr:PIN domain-containing protein [Nocardia cyriacigeorgica]MBF6437418.1 PIN domain-containing protein [Nocardia cyriacigeorgica]